MSGTLALVGAGEFLPQMENVDRVLLEKSGGTRVVVLPTASAPDGPGVPEKWAKMGAKHFSRLGARVDALLALTREDCARVEFIQCVRAANLIYFSGGKPAYLYETLVKTQLWDAVRAVFDRGGVIAGCSAGAMIMGAHVPHFTRKLGIPSVEKWRAGFALVPRAIIVPHYNEFPEVMLKLFTGATPRDAFIIGIDAETALVGNNSAFQVMGAGRVTIRRDGKVERFRAGENVSL
ncbi:MAG: Type 1 glutamine amidotransferase-like domain-containing protein [Chloroflexi bacterium]|nr:Type 1 glutamine amidotransferase-like domain-containing protein [Chloroflexota bacterium]